MQDVTVGHISDDKDIDFCIFQHQAEGLVCVQSLWATGDIIFRGGSRRQAILSGEPREVRV